jgi:putative protein kinase ArgK-like GTPase of G3E family
MLDLGLKDKDIPPVIKTVATEGKGVNVLMEEIQKFSTKKDREFKEARRKRLIAWMLKDIAREFWS